MVRNDLIVKFLRDVWRLNSLRLQMVPLWDLSIVLRALKGPPFEPLISADLQPLALKTALLLALVSVKRVGDIQALLVSASCLEFGPNDSMVVLKPRHGYVPKVLSTAFRAQVGTLLALPIAEGKQGPNLLCPVRAVRIYLEYSSLFQQTEQLFVCFGVTKQRLSCWIADAIALAYTSAGLQCPTGVRAHSTRGTAFS